MRGGGFLTPQPPLAGYGFTYVQSQRLFRTNFNIGRHGDEPERSTVANWLSLFTGSTQGKTGGSLKIVCTPHECGKSKELPVNHSPKRSARKQSFALQISDRSLRRILHEDLHFHPYKIQIAQELKVPDFSKRISFGTRCLESTMNYHISLIYMSEMKLICFLFGNVSRPNSYVLYWSASNLQFTLGRLQSKSGGIIWSYFRVNFWGLLFWRYWKKHSCLKPLCRQ